MGMKRRKKTTGCQSSLTLALLSISCQSIPSLARVLLRAGNIFSDIGKHSEDMCYLPNNCKTSLRRSRFQCPRRTGFQTSSLLTPGRLNFVSEMLPWYKKAQTNKWDQIGP